MNDNVSGDGRSTARWGATQALSGRNARATIGTAEALATTGRRTRAGRIGMEPDRDGAGSGWSRIGMEPDRDGAGSG